MNDLPSFELKIIRTFDNPIIFKYDSAEYKLIGIVYSGKGGYDWGKISYEKNMILEKNEIEKLQKCISSLDMNKLIEKENIFGCDGSSWDLTIGKNIVISKWTPTSDTYKRGLQTFVDLGKYLWKTIGINESIKEIY